MWKDTTFNLISTMLHLLNLFFFLYLFVKNDNVKQTYTYDTKVSGTKTICKFRTTFP